MSLTKHSRSLVAERKPAEASARLDVAYIPPAELPSHLALSGAYPMAIISFGHALPQPFSCPVIALDLPQIEGAPVVEVWTCDRPTQTQEDSGCALVMNGEFLFGSISLVEPPVESLDVTTYAGYREMLHRLREVGYPYLWRAWNYFPGINDNQRGLERYRRFCVGRHQALIETLSDFPSSLPAATAVGTRSGPLQIVFLAGTQPATHLGNPRQFNAYEYPRQYGPRSPSFARATCTRLKSQSLLCIAGTASVVGHASRHVGLPYEQAKETMQNLRAVLTHTE